MNRVQAFYDYTVKLLDLLENKSEIDRDQKILLINKFLEKREIEMDDLSAPYTDQEMVMGGQLVKLNRKLEILLNHEKLLIQNDIKDLHEKRKTNQKYSNPYNGISMGGAFYDKRK